MVHGLICVFSGQTLTIEAKGTLHEKIDKGATVLLEVKYGLISLIRQSADLCEQIENVDLHCPLEKGDMVLKKQVELPKQIPPVCDMFNYKIRTLAYGRKLMLFI